MSFVRFFWCFTQLKSVHLYATCCLIIWILLESCTFQCLQRYLEVTSLHCILSIMIYLPNTLQPLSHVTCMARIRRWLIVRYGSPWNKDDFQDEGDIPSRLHILFVKSCYKQMQWLHLRRLWMPANRWARDDDLISGWFLNRFCAFKAISHFSTATFGCHDRHLLYIYILYVFLISMCMFYAFNLEVYLIWFQCSCVFSCWCAVMLDQRHWDGAVLIMEIVPDLYAWKVMEMMIMEIVLFAYNYYILTELSFIFIYTYLRCAIIKSFANLVNTVYHLNYRPKCIFLISNVYIRKLNMIIFSTAEILHRGSKKRFDGWVQVRIKELLSDEKAIFSTVFQLTAFSGRWWEVDW